LRYATINAVTSVGGVSGLVACSSDFDDPSTQTSNDGQIDIGLSSALALSACSPDDPSKVGSIGVSSSSSARISDTAIIGNESIQGDGAGALMMFNGDVTLNDSTVDGRVVVADAGAFGMRDSTVNGGLNASNNSVVTLNENAFIVADRASNGTCPTGDGIIRVKSGAILHVQLASSSVEGFLEVDEADLFDSNGSLSNIDVLPDSPLAGESGINICNW
jgi:hypothetical protein